MAAFIWRIDFRNENWIDLSAINQFEFTEFANELARKDNTKQI